MWPPGDGDAESGLGFVEGAARGLEAQAGISRARAEGFGDVEGDTAERAAYLRGEVAIAARHGFDERARELDGVKDLVEELLCFRGGSEGGGGSSSRRRRGGGGGGGDRASISGSRSPCYRLCFRYCLCLRNRPRLPNHPPLPISQFPPRPFPAVASVLVLIVTFDLVPELLK